MSASERHTFDSIGISLVVPDGWSLQPDVHVGALAIYPTFLGAPDPAIGGPVVSMLMKYFGPKLTLDLMNESQISEIKEIAKKNPKIEYNATVLGLTGTKALYEAVIDKRTYQFLVQWTIAYDCGYIVTTVCPKELMKNHNPALKGLFSNTKIFPPKPTSLAFTSFEHPMFFIRYPKEWTISKTPERMVVANIKSAFKDHPADIMVMVSESKGSLKEHVDLVKISLEKQLVSTLEESSVELGTVPAKILNWTTANGVTHFYQLLAIDPLAPATIVTVTGMTTTKKFDVVHDIFTVALRSFRFSTDVTSFTAGTEGWDSYINLALRFGFSYSDMYNIYNGNNFGLPEITLVPAEEVDEANPSSCLNLIVKDCRAVPSNLVSLDTQTISLVENMKKVFVDNFQIVGDAQDTTILGHPAHFVTLSGDIESTETEVENRTFFYKHTIIAEPVSQCCSIVFCLGTLTTNRSEWADYEKSINTIFWC